MCCLGVSRSRFSDLIYEGGEGDMVRWCLLLFKEGWVYFTGRGLGRGWRSGRLGNVSFQVICGGYGMVCFVPRGGSAELSLGFLFPSFYFSDWDMFGSGRFLGEWWNVTRITLTVFLIKLHHDAKISCMYSQVWGPEPLAAPKGYIRSFPKLPTHSFWGLIWMHALWLNDALLRTCRGMC
jgi:hypothetical protein